ncbi:hypothetical protein RFI_22000 [Reticulomyxa filosa]|uniref:Uncharacterized protein n=1 Tax=Reticulomyxa filosa TaxID=46433 RepID=X6MPN6_RETFI|nr:hypothetical protein RFI_22000 [Reticulomyxa filosa]|eukprot:ETO15367.1 hypothetical protein RFI_22000 [Reticulomyxa filosa]
MTQYLSQNKASDLQIHRYDPLTEVMLTVKNGVQGTSWEEFPRELLHLLISFLGYVESSLEYWKEDKINHNMTLFSATAEDNESVFIITPPQYETSALHYVLSYLTFVVLCTGKKICFDFRIQKLSDENWAQCSDVVLFEKKGVIYERSNEHAPSTWLCTIDNIHCKFNSNCSYVAYLEERPQNGLSKPIEFCFIQKQYASHVRSSVSKLVVSAQMQNQTVSDKSRVDFVKPYEACFYPSFTP